MKPLYIPYVCVCACVWLQQTKAKYEIEAERRELARLLEKRTQEVENLTGKTSAPKTGVNTACYITVHTLVFLFRYFGFSGNSPVFFISVNHVCVCVCAEDVNRLNEKLTETNKCKMELQLKLDDIQSSETSVQVHTTSD